MSYTGTGTPGANNVPTRPLDQGTQGGWFSSGTELNFIWLNRIAALLQAVVELAPAAETAGKGDAQIAAAVRYAAQSLGIEPQGAWADGAAYQAGHAVVVDGIGGYLCRAAHSATTTNKPGSGAGWTTYWHFIFPAGPAGPKGDPGPTGSGAYDTAGQRITLDVDGDTYLEAAGDDVATIYASGTEALRVSGTLVSVAKPVEINKPTDFWGSGPNGEGLHTAYGFLGSNGGFALSLFSNGYRNSSGGFTAMGINGNANAAGIDLDPTGKITLRTGLPSGTTVPARMTVTAAGFVGINTATPAATLDVAGNAVVSGTLTVGGQSITPGGSGGAELVAIAEDRKAQGIAGGSASASGVKRTLNTSVHAGTGVSLANDALTLPAGTYEIEWEACAYLSAGVISYLRDGAGTVLAQSMPGFANAAHADTTNGVARLTFAASTAIELWQVSQSARATDGHGAAANRTGFHETYARIIARKIA
ncbi:MAG: hypothetical protein AAFO79_01685 [Pseudomonadota bacterium]